MPKGTFFTPRPVGSVDEARVTGIKIRLIEDGTYDFNIAVEEGDTSSGSFEVMEDGTVRTNEDDLSNEDQAALNNILKVALSLYVEDRGYSGVVVN